MKKLSLILALMLLLFPWCSCTDAEEPPEESPAEFTVRTDVTLENLRYNEDGKGCFHITVVNHTDAPVWEELYFYVEKKIEGRWTYVPFVRDEARYHDLNYSFGVGENEIRLEEAISFEQLPGEFRLLLGRHGDIRVETNANGVASLAFKQEAALIVGYITVTEEPQFGPLTEKDGLLQSELITMKDVYYENGRVYFTIENQSDYSPHVSGYPWVQKKVNGEWQSVALLNPKEYGKGYGTHLNIRGENTFDVDVNGSYFARAGEYRIYFGPHLSEYGTLNMTQRFETEYFYIVGYLTIE